MEYMCVCEVLELYGGHSCHTHSVQRTRVAHRYMAGLSSVVSREYYVE